MEAVSDYLLRTENTVRILLQKNEEYRAKIRVTQEIIALSGIPFEKTKSIRYFNDWWIKNQEDRDIIFDAYRQYSIEAFISSLLAGSVLEIAGQLIEIASNDVVIPDEWTRIFKKRFLPSKFFTGRIVHTVPLGLIVYCGRNHYRNGIDRMDEAINQEVFSRLAAHGHQFEFQDFIELGFEYRRLHSQYLTSNLLNTLGWSDYDQYFEDMNAALL